MESHQVVEGPEPFNLISHRSRCEGVKRPALSTHCVSTFEHRTDTEQFSHAEICLCYKLEMRYFKILCGKKLPFQQMPSSDQNIGVSWLTYTI